MKMLMNLRIRVLWIAVIVAAAATARADEPAWWRADSDGRRFLGGLGDRKLAVYQATPNPFKPYMLRLFTPNGRQVIRDQVADHLHHHGLMFALSVDGVSYWDETPSSGKQSVAKTEVLDGGTLSQRLRWVDSQGKHQLSETRFIHLHAVDDVTLLTWGSTLSVAQKRNPAVLTGHHYYGLGMRFIDSLDQTVAFANATNSPGEVVRGTEKLTRGDWVSCTGPMNDKAVTVAMFSHPDNPRHPAWWFTMNRPFAYQSATLNLWKQPLTLQQGQTLGLIFGVALLDGEVSRKEIDTLCSQWANPASRVAKAMATDN